MTVKQISVFLENRYGQLNEITDLLAAQGIDLKAISIAETSDYGIVRFIPDDVDKATATLINAGMVISVNPVSVVSVPDVVGGLNSVLSKFSAAGINVKYMYSAVSTKDGRAQMIFKVDEPEKIEDIL